ncbi:hypothetical protein AVEN_159050-1 [Araneus ventricosus]|uniref:Uncharacterized protein n=1 Tax=Araneus ventricosus TaxID=182803 RepID=A0A4Y2H319_ARAVE|nr:hypothetical protein AVEN_159050-1 [Araneus ventricosus]
MKGHGGLVVRSRLRCRRVRGSKPGFTKRSAVCGLTPIKSESWAKPPSADKVWKIREGAASSGVVLVISLQSKISRYILK